MYVLAYDQSVCTDRNRVTLLMYEWIDSSVIESVLVVLTSLFFFLRVPTLFLNHNYRTRLNVISKRIHERKRSRLQS